MVRSLYPKLVITSEMLEYDIFAISETHLDSYIGYYQINLTGFHPPLRRDWIDKVVVSFYTYPITCTSRTEVILNHLILKSYGLNSMHVVNFF